MSLPVSKLTWGIGDAPVTGAWIPMTISLLVIPAVSFEPFSLVAASLKQTPPVVVAEVAPSPEPAATSLPATPLFCPHAAASSTTTSTDVTIRNRCDMGTPSVRRGRRAGVAAEGAGHATDPAARRSRLGEGSQGQRRDQRQHQYEWDQQVHADRLVARQVAHLGRVRGSDEHGSQRQDREHARSIGVYRRNMNGWDPDAELTIKMGPCSNGEFRPSPLGPVELEAIRRTREEADHHAHRLGIGRREFLRSLGGAALMLGVLAACHDDANRAKGKRSGGGFKIDKDATTEPDAAKQSIAGDEASVYVQTHYFNYDLAVAGGVSGLAGLSAIFPQNRCGEADARACFSVEQYLDLLFGQSDTNMTVLSAIPIVEQANPLKMEDME